MNVWEGIVFATLVGLVVFQQLQIQKLVNKVMSRSYYEYESAQRTPSSETPKLKLPEGEEEDFGVMADFGVGA